MADASEDNPVETLSMRLALAALGLSAVAFVGGLVAFSERIAKISAAAASEAMPPFDKGTGLAVFTGGKARIESAMNLLNGGAGDRLLISGVNPDTSRDEVDAHWGGPESRFACCVDIGHRASTTVGNASEVEEWAALHRFKRVVIITSDYHMPRATLETRRRLAGVEVIAYPVASDAATAPMLRRDWRTLASEYVKFLAASARSLVDPPKTPA
ncbi:MAG: YdcF family protein [Alphaproteobacteria bacterium]|nr:YdcF family protein [Alphaproteobacteria bacterium]